MSFNFKNTAQFVLIFCGFLIFLINAIELNSNLNNINITNSLQSPKSVSNLKDTPNKSQVEVDDSIDKFSKNENKSKNKETIIIIKKGQTFLSILDNFNFENKKKFEIINAINAIYDLRELKVNQKIIFLTNNKEKVENIIIELNYNTNLEADLRSGIKIEKKELETISEIESKDYVITNSLYADGINNNIPNQILIKLIQLFSFDLDFQRDIQKDTKVSLSYEIISIKNKSEYSFGDIIYANIKIKKNTLEYFKFLTDDGFIDYFNRQGKNVKKSILKTPLDGARISSSFGMRKHPI